MMSRRWHRPSWFSVVLTIAAVVLFARLGLWQYARMQEKQVMLDAVADVIAQRKPVALAHAAHDAAREHTYDWAAGTGAFAGVDPLLLDDQMHEGRVGVRVYRVFFPDDEAGTSGGALLVDMGWLPLAANRALPEMHFSSEGHSELRGLLAPPPSAGLALGTGFEHKSGAWLATRIDIAALAPAILPSPKSKGAAQLAPRVLRLDPALPLGFARDLDVLPNTLPPARHLGYAVQWFAFAVAALVIFVLLHFRKVER